VGQDEGSLTEQQTKQRVTTTILIRGIYQTAKCTEQLSPPDDQRAPEPELTSPWPAPPLRTEHSGTWYRILQSVWPVWVSLPFCVPSWLLVKINPVPSKPRTSLNIELEMGSKTSKPTAQQGIQ